MVLDPRAPARRPGVEILAGGLGRGVPLLQHGDSAGRQELDGHAGGAPEASMVVSMEISTWTPPGILWWTSHAPSGR